MKIKLFIVTCIIVLFASCKTGNQITYFQDLDKKVMGTQPNFNYEVRICPDDQLAISVSSIDPNAVVVFNLPLTNYLTPGDEKITGNPVMQTYLVDSNGYIDFPVIGRFKVVGYTRTELAEKLKIQISAYAKSPMVTIKIQNFKISVMGEVNTPGTQIVSNERVSILDAISLAGDLTIYGERENVLLIRENCGKKEYHRFNLTSSNMLTSPYFYLQQNDIIYVEPNKARKSNSKYSQSSQFNISVASTIVSAISVITSLTIALLVK